jgi:hypothetical protein
VGTLGARRAGNPPELVASSEKIRRELAWKPESPDLKSIIESAWKWHSAHPDGYPDWFPPVRKSQAHSTRDWMPAWNVPAWPGAPGKRRHRDPEGSVLPREKPVLADQLGAWGAVARAQLRQVALGQTQDGFELALGIMSMKPDQIELLKRALRSRRFVVVQMIPEGGFQIEQACLLGGGLRVHWQGCLAPFEADVPLVQNVESFVHLGEFVENDFQLVAVVLFDAHDNQMKW